MTDERGDGSYTIGVYPADAFRVVAGANHGDAMGEAETLCPGDVYRLSAGVEALPLSVADAGLARDATSGAPVLSPRRGVHRVADRSVAGASGAVLSASARATMLAPDGHSVDLVLIETHAHWAERFVFPLGPLQPGQDYTLAGVGAPGEIRLADVVPFAFAAGTRIMLADGTQRPVEALQTGDMVLTRDSGPQPILGLFRQTERAIGAYAPVVIPPDTFGNPGDLVLSQHQRLLIYQRDSDRLTDTAEMLVRAGDLVDGRVVYLRQGGFADYVTVVLKGHEMLYAECVAVESLEVSPATRHRLAEAQARAVADLTHKPHFGSEAGREIAARARARLLGGTE